MTDGDDASDADRVLAALGDGSRRAIIGLLAQSPCSVSDLANALGITKTAIGQHIVVLETCRLLQSEKQGRVRLCRLDQEGFNTLQRWISHHRGHWERNLDRLGEVLDEQQQVSDK